MRRLFLLVLFVLGAAPQASAQTEVFPGKVRVNSTAVDALCVGSSGGATPTCTGGVKAGPISGTTGALSTSVSTPSIVTASGALGVTPAAGSGVNFNLSTTGDFAVNANQLYVDTSAAAVGIGTSTPAFALQVINAGRTIVSTGGPSSSSGAVGDFGIDTSNAGTVGGLTYWRASFRTDTYGAGTAGSLVFYNSSGSYAMGLKPNNDAVFGGALTSIGAFTGSTTINAVTGYKVNGAAAAGAFLRGDGTNFVGSTLTLPNAATSTYLVYATGTNAWGESSSLTFNGTSLIAPRVNANGTLASGSYNFDVLGAAGADRTPMRVGILTVTNGFTVNYSNTSGLMNYQFITGNMNIGGATLPTTGQNVLIMAQATAPTGMGSNSGAFYTLDVAGTATPYAINEAGVTMRLTGAANDTLATVVQDNIVRLGTVTTGGFPAANLTGTTLASNVITSSISQLAGSVGIGNAALTTIGLFINSSALTGVQQVGIQNNPVFTSAALTQGIGYYGKLQTAASAFTMPQGVGLYIDTPSIGAGSAITTIYGLYIAPQTAATTNNFAIRTDAGLVRFGDSVGVGGPAFPTVGTKVLMFSQGTAMTTLGADTAGLQAVDVGGTAQMFAVGETGVSIQLTGAATNTLATAVQDNITRLGTISTATTFSSLATFASGIEITGGAFAAGRIVYSAFSGLIIDGKAGSTYDFTVLTPGGSDIIRVPTGTQNITFAGIVTASGFGTHAFSAGGVGGNIVRLNNTTAGTGNFARLGLGNDLGSERFNVSAWSSTSTFGGPNPADGMTVASGGTGGLVLYATTGADVQIWSRAALAATFGVSQALTLTGALSGTSAAFSTSVSTPSIITASGALGVTPAAGSNLNVNLSTTGDFVVNSTQLYVDTSAAFVGIGSASPGTKLTVETNSASGLESSGDVAQVRVQNTNAGGYSGVAINRSANTRAAGVYYRTANADDWFAGTAYGGGVANSLFSIGTSITLANAKFAVASTGNAALGTTTFPSSGTNGLIFGQGTALATMGSNTAGIQAVDVSGTAQMVAVNESGVTIQLTGAATNTLATAVQGNITSLGTIAAGVWNGTLIGALYGGTGLNTSASTGIARVAAGAWAVDAAYATGATTATGYLFSANGLTSGNTLKVTGSTATPGTLAPGALSASVGTLHVQGNVGNTFTSASDPTLGMSALFLSDATLNSSTAFSGNYNALLISRVTGSGAATQVGLYSYMIDTTAKANTLTAIDAQIDITIGASGAKSIFGVASTPSVNATALNGMSVYGLYSAPALQAGLSTTGTANVYGFQFSPVIQVAAVTAVNSYGARISPYLTGASGALTSYGVYVDNATMDTNGTTTQYQVYLAAPSGADANWALYSAGTASSFLGGPIQFGDATAAPTLSANAGAVYGADVSTTVNMFAVNEANDVARLTGVTARNSSQFDKAASTTLANVTGLSLATQAGKTYGFEAKAYVIADSAGGVKFAMAGTTTATAVIYTVRCLDEATNTYAIVSTQTALGGAAVSSGSTALYCAIDGTIVVNAAGTLTVQFAQYSAAGTSSVRANSTLTFQQIQ